jgi:hypothetical protein
MVLRRLNGKVPGSPPLDRLLSKTVISPARPEAKRLIRHSDREEFSFREGFSSNKRKILHDHGPASQ